MNALRTGAFVILAGLALAAERSWAGTVIYVDGTATGAGNGASWADAFTTVQAGLIAAKSGDRVWVKAGRYVTHITLKAGVGLYGGFAGTEDPATFNLRDRDLVGNETILDGNYGTSVVTAPSGTTETCRIDGFTITKGHGTYLGADKWGGGGLYLLGSPTVVNNKITANPGGDFGGGVYGRGTIVNNRIVGNGAALGGGICGTGTITNNVVAGNYANYGGGLYGGGTIVNNTIVCNSVGSSYDGGGVYLSSTASATIANNIIAFNSSGVHRFGSATTPTLARNCVFGNSLYNFSGLPDPTGSNGNICADPLFVQCLPGPDGSWGTADDIYGDLRLAAGSPCIDAGDNGAVPADTPDLDGDGNITERLPYDLNGLPRFSDDPNTWDTGAGVPPIVDMGAYEYYQQGDLNCDGDVSNHDIDGFVLALFDAESYRAQFPHCDIRNADFTGDGLVNNQDIDGFLAALFGR